METATPPMAYPKGALLIGTPTHKIGEIVRYNELAKLPAGLESNEGVFKDQSSPAFCSDRDSLGETNRLVKKKEDFSEIFSSLSVLPAQAPPTA